VSTQPTDPQDGFSVGASSADRVPAARQRVDAHAAHRGGAQRWVPWVKVTVFMLALLPLLRLVVSGMTDRLGANPVEFITRSTGTWTLVLLCVTLAITPVRRLPGLAWLLRFRRMLGLFAFFYAALHFTTYFWLDQWFDWTSIARDVTGKRPFITMGFAAFVLMVPLALTSPHAMVRRLGRHRWQRLHRAIYAIAVLAILHYWWMKAGKHDFAEPAIYAIVVACLLGARVLWALRRQRVQTPAGSSRSPANSDSIVSRSRTR
jgi:sulfoxide reductase heme-binding subunit YedZ